MGDGDLIFHHESDDSFIRTGECCQCGECCKTGDPFAGEMGEAQIPGACPLLAFHAGLYTCTDRQNSYYLMGCNVWPTHPGQISDKPSCSYKFQKVE